MYIPKLQRRHVGRPVAETAQLTSVSNRPGPFRTHPEYISMRVETRGFTSAPIDFPYLRCRYLLMA